MGKRKSTRYPGVQARESETRRHKGKPDVCFTIDYRDAQGKRIRKDVGWASEGFSAALAAEMRARLVNAEKTAQAMGEPSPSRKAAQLTFKEAWEKYRDGWLIPNGKNATNAEAMMRQHLASFQPLPLSAITAYKLDQLMAEMRQKGLSSQTIRNAVTIVRSIMKRMAKWGLYSGQMPFEAITLPKLNNQRVRFLTPEEARALLAELEKRSRQTWLMALISLHCGLRFGEIARLTWGSVNFETMSLYIPEAKSGHARHAVMTPEVAGAIEALPKGARQDLLFPARGGGIMKQTSDSFERAVNAIGLNDTGETIKNSQGDSVPARITDRRLRVVFHTLRHTYASWLARSGQGQLAIADRLGHRSLEMTKRYTHIMDETRLESARAISRIFHGEPPGSQ